jgi:hypothetical protein
MPERDALKVVLAKWKIWLANVLGGAGLLAATYGWFWIPDEKTWHLAFSVVAALAITTACIYLTAVTVSALAGTPVCFGRCAMWLAVLSVWIGLVEWLGASAPRLAAWLASLLTMVVRKPVSPASLAPISGFFWTVILWAGIIALVPLLSLPARNALKSLRRWRYWLAAAAGAVVGFWLPWRIFHWAPGFEGFSVQVASVVIRLVIAWMVMVTAWMWLVALAARGTSTVVRSSD